LEDRSQLHTPASFAPLNPKLDDKPNIEQQQQLQRENGTCPKSFEQILPPSAPQHSVPQFLQVLLASWKHGSPVLESSSPYPLSSVAAFLPPASREIAAMMAQKVKQGIRSSPPMEE